MERIAKSPVRHTRLLIAAIQGILFALNLGTATANAGSPPSFSLDPTNQTVFTESVATLTSSATSSDPFTYQWLFNDSPLPLATNASLTFTNVALNNAGHYVSVAENSFGATTSLVATLTIIPRPGTVDSRFNIGTGPNSYVAALCPLPDGSIYVGGYFTSFDGSRRWSIARLKHNGTVDPQFRARRLESPFSDHPAPSPVFDSVTAIVVQADGKVIMSGRYYAFSPQTPTSIMRFNPDGSEDPFIPRGAQPPRVFSLALSHDGKILILDNYRLARYLQNGEIDRSFGTNNIFDVVSECCYHGAVIRPQPDGKILVGGAMTTYQQTNQVGRILRVNPDGTLDKTFSLTTQFPLNPPTAIILDSNGRIVIGMPGVTVPGSDPPQYSSVIRLNSDGSQDLTFLPVSFASFFQAPSTSAIIEQTGGRLLVVGARNTNSSDSSNVYLIRYEPTGEIDSTFRTPLVGSDSGSVSIMAAMTDGTILLGGSYTQFNGDPTNRYLTRIYADQFTPTAPVIAYHPSDLSLLSGTNLTLSSIAAGTPPIQYQWLKQNAPVTPGVRVSGDTNFVLTVSNLTRADSGLYRLMASNSIGMALSDPASVIVRSPQRILAPESLPDGSLRLRFADQDGGLASVTDLARFRVESSTNLVDWVSVTNTASIGSSFLEIIDTNTVSRSACFYRVIEQ